MYTFLCIQKQTLNYIKPEDQNRDVGVFKQTLIANAQSMVPAHDNYFAACIKSYEAVFSDLIIKVRFNLKQNQLHSDV